MIHFGLPACRKLSRQEPILLDHKLSQESISCFPFPKYASISCLYYIYFHFWDNGGHSNGPREGLRRLLPLHPLLYVRDKRCLASLSCFQMFRVKGRNDTFGFLVGTRNIGTSLPFFTVFTLAPLAALAPGIRSRR